MRRRRHGLDVGGGLGRGRGDLLGERAGRARRPAPGTFGALADFLGAARYAADDAFHAAIEAVGQRRHHRRAIGFRRFALRGRVLLHAAHGLRILAEHLDRARHVADLVAALAAGDHLVELAAGEALHAQGHLGDRP